MMSREEAIASLKACAKDTDVEVAHSAADDILTDYLWDLGEKEIVLAYGAVPKLFA